MNILIFNYEYPPIGGGGGVFTKQVAEELSKRYDVTVVTSRFNRLPKYEKVNGVEIYRVSVFFRRHYATATILSMLAYFPSSLWRGFWLLLRNRYNIINAHFAIPTGPSSLILAKMFRLPYMLSIHGGDIYDPSKRLSPHSMKGLYWIVKIVLSNANRLIAQSSDTKNNAENIYHIKKKIDIIPLGVSPVSFVKRSRDDLKFHDDDILLVTVSRLIPRKSIHLLIEIIAGITEKVKLIIIGSGPEKDRLQNLASDRGIRERVFFTGYVDDEQKFQLLNISDIFVASAMHEGFGVHFLEAMCCGLPIVTFNKGGMRDFLIDGKTGYLVESGDINRLKDRIELLCTNTDLRKKMGEYNREYVKNYYIKKCAEKYEDYFQSLIGCHR